MISSAPINPRIVVSAPNLCHPEMGLHFHILEPADFQANLDVGWIPLKNERVYTTWGLFLDLILAFIFLYTCMWIRVYIYLYKYIYIYNTFVYINTIYLDSDCSKQPLGIVFHIHQLCHVSRFFGVESYLGVTNFKPRLVPGTPPVGSQGSRLLGSWIPTSKPWICFSPQKGIGFFKPLLFCRDHYI